jgi:energy-coupling factor transporter ATP-binding protein EcfA2
MPVIRISKLSYTYESQTEPAIRDISLSIAAGEWVSLVGPGGSGKTTLCSLLCGLLQGWPGGSIDGELLINGQDRTHSTATDVAGEIAMIPGDAESSLVLEYVEDELAFGPENLCVPSNEIERRIDEGLAAVGMFGVRKRRTSELSGGQQQRISIASVLTMQPGILVLDNAEANLDAPSVERLQTALCELHAQGHTIVTASTRLNPSSKADRIIVLDGGRIAWEGATEELIGKHGGQLIQLGVLPEVKDEAVGINPIRQGTPLLKLDRLSFGYGSSRGSKPQPVLRNLSMELYEGEILALLGPNGVGKTTLAKLLAGLLPPPLGAISLCGKDIAQISPGELARTVGFVFQRPEHQFLADTVLDECLIGPDLYIDEEKKQLAEQWLWKFGLADYKHMNPYRLQSAEKRMLNLLTAMMRQPNLLILDEPTSGLDYRSTDALMRHCAEYIGQNSGKAILMITHDIEAVQRWATRAMELG